MTPQEMPLEDPLMVAFFDADDALTVHIDPNQIPDGVAAGLILADFANHMADMLHQNGSAPSVAQALVDLRTTFNAELDTPTDMPNGPARN